MNKDKVKIAAAVACLVVAGVVVAWQFGVFGGSGASTSASSTPGSSGGQTAGAGAKQEGEGITISNPGGFEKPEPRSR